MSADQSKPQAQSEPPKEWWISAVYEDAKGAYFTEKEALENAWAHDPTNVWHVVEHSAYTALQAECARLNCIHDRLTERYNASLEKRDTLETEVERLTKERDVLKRKYDFRGQTIEGMEKIGERHSRERDELAAQCATSAEAITLLGVEVRRLTEERDALRSVNLSKQIFIDQIEKESRHERDALAAQIKGLELEQVEHIEILSREFEAQLAEANVALKGAKVGWDVECAVRERLERALVDACKIAGLRVDEVLERE